jgi:hypothetical protein
MTVPIQRGYTTPAPLIPNAKDFARQISAAVTAALSGKLNSVASITLAANATSTTLTDTRIGASTFIGFSPMTANAATAVAGLYVSDQKTGVATLKHASSAHGDQTFSVLMIG